MVTNRPLINPHWAWAQLRRDMVLESKWLKGPRYDVCADHIMKIYRERSARVFIQNVARIAVARAGGQQVVADWLEMHRSVVSVAINHGELGAQPLAALMSNILMLQQLSEQYCNIRNVTGQTAFIEASIAAASLMNQPEEAPPLNPVNYELLCRIIERCQEQDAGATLPPTVVTSIVRSVATAFRAIGKNRRETIPWDEMLLDQLYGEAFALAHVKALQQHWLNIFVFVADVTEDLGAFPSRI